MKKAVIVGSFSSPEEILTVRDVLYKHGYNAYPDEDHFKQLNGLIHYSNSKEHAIKRLQLMKKIEERYGLICPNCGRYSRMMVHASINGNDANFCDEVCILSYNRKNPSAQITIIEGFCEHGDEDYEDFFERCKKCGYIRRVR